MKCKLKLIDLSSTNRSEDGDDITISDGGFNVKLDGFDKGKVFVFLSNEDVSSFFG